MLLIIWLRLGNLFLNLIRNDVYKMPLNLVWIEGHFCATTLGSGADARTERPYIVDSLCSLRRNLIVGFLEFSILMLYLIGYKMVVIL